MKLLEGNVPGNLVEIATSCVHSSLARRPGFNAYRISKFLRPTEEPSLQLFYSQQRPHGSSYFCHDVSRNEGNKLAELWPVKVDICTAAPEGGTTTALSVIKIVLQLPQL